MRQTNGTIRKAVIGLLTAVTLTFATWVGTQLVDHSARLAAQEAHTENLKEWLNKIEKKLDKALGVGGS